MKKPEFFLNDIHCGLSIIHLGFKGKEIVDNDAEIFVLFDNREAIHFFWIDNLFVVPMPEALVVFGLRTSFVCSLVNVRS